MKEAIFLKSMHGCNFRHNKEDARVVDLVMFTPENLKPRPCYKVEYESDGMIDHIACQSVEDGHWAVYMKEQPI